MTSSEIAAIMAGVAPVINDHVTKRLGPLLARIAELESRTANFRYCGVFRQGDSYALGNFVTHDGSVWHANRDTDETPGTPGGAWQLAVKRGRSDRR
jgi:hypothetical protein